MSVEKPQLEQYPGYFPEGSRPFWTRLKVGVVASMVGLLIGVAGGSDDGGQAAAASAAAAEAADAAAAAETSSNAELAEALDENAQLEEELQQSEDEAADALTSATKQLKQDARASLREAVRAAVVKARADEQRKAAVAVQEARSAAAAAAAAAPATTSPAPLASTGGSTDPRFSWCYEANAAGFGPYYQGQDPEYDWYDDRDGDGIVCET